MAVPIGLVPGEAARGAVRVARIGVALAGAARHRCRRSRRAAGTLAVRVVQPRPPSASGSLHESSSSVSMMIGDERVGAEEVVALLEDRRVDAVEVRLRRADRRVELDGVVRIRLDEEAVPALELRLEAAAVLADAGDEALEVRGDGGVVGLLGHVRIRGARVVRSPGGSHARKLPPLPSSGLASVDRRLGGPSLGLRAIEEVAAIVVVTRADGRHGRAGAGLADVGRAAAAERRGDDADVQVVDRRELELEPGGADRSLPCFVGLARTVGSSALMQSGAKRRVSEIGYGLLRAGPACRPWKRSCRS